MNLYEVTNWYMGCAHVRVYAWAPNMKDAFFLAEKKFRDAGRHSEPEYYEDLSARLLFSQEAETFVTEVSDSGWETGRVVECPEDTSWVDMNYVKNHGDPYECR